MNFLRRLLPYLTVALVMVAIYDGITFYTRWKRVQDDERRQADAVQKDAQQTISALGGNDLKILTFYALPAAIAPGKSASMCYGVNAATKVTISPVVPGPIYPAYSRCLQVSPERSTEYTLTAEDSAGHQLQQKLEVKVIR